MRQSVHVAIAAGLALAGIGAVVWLRGPLGGSASTSDVGRTDAPSTGHVPRAQDGSYRAVVPIKGPVVGTAVDEDGAPVAGALLELRAVSGAVEQAISDDHGRFDFARPERLPGEYVAVVRDGVDVGAAWVDDRGGVAAADFNVVVRGGQSLADLEVSVETPVGMSPDGIVVECRWPGAIESVVPKAEGRARFHVLAGPVAVHVQWRGGSFATTVVVPPEGRSVRLAPMHHAISGRAIGPDGEPVVRRVNLVAVAHVPHPITGGPSEVVFDRVLSLAFSAGPGLATRDLRVPLREVMTGPDGAFRFDDVGEGTYVVTASSDPAMRAGVACAAGDTAVRLVVHDFDMTGDNRITPRGPTGEALLGGGRFAAGTVVGELVVRDGTAWREVSKLEVDDSDAGVLTIGPVVVDARAPLDALLRIAGCRPTRVERLRLPSASPVAVAVEPCGGIVGTLRGVGSWDSQDAKAVASPSSGAAADLHLTSEPGTTAFALPGLEPGRYVVRVVPRRGGPPWAVAPAEVEIRGTEIARLDLIAVPGAAILLPFRPASTLRDRVTVRAVDPSGRVLAETTATTRDLELIRIERWLEPEAHLTGLLPGRYTLEGTWDGQPMPSRTIDLTAGATAVVALPLK